MDPDCVCDPVKKLKAKCNGRRIIATVKFTDGSHHGETVTIGIGDEGHVVEIRRHKAKLRACCFKEKQIVSLLEPPGCVKPVRVECS